jgi:hypothetical protein
MAKMIRTSYLVKLKQQSSHVEASIAGKYLTRVGEMYKNNVMKREVSLFLNSLFKLEQVD